MRSWQLTTRWAAGIALLGILVWVAGPTQLVDAARAASPGWAIATTIVLVPWFLLGPLNVWLLLQRLAPVPFGTFSQVYVTSWAASLFLPGQLGDATQVVLLRRHQVPIAASSAAYVTDKVLSLVFLLLIGGAGLAFYAPRSPLWSLAAVLLAGIAFVAAALALIWRRVPSSVHRVSTVREAFRRVAHNISMFAREPRVLIVNLTITIAKWGLVTLSYFCAFRTFDTPIPVFAAATVPVISSLVGYLPVTVGGLGTTEWTAVALFARVGASQAAVLAAYLFLRSALIVLAALILSLGRQRVVGVEGA